MIAYEDVRHVTAARLRDDLGRLPDVIVGSPPCQDASVANHRGQGLDGERTGLFHEFVRIVGECRPVVFAAENVTGLARRGLDRVVGLLAAEGYAVDVWNIGADSVGAPHRRKRLWIVGIRNDIADAEPQGRGRWDETTDKPEAAEATRASSDGGSPLAGHQPDRDRGMAEADAADADERRDGCGEAGGAGPGRVGLGEGPLAEILWQFPDWNGGPAALGDLDDGCRAVAARRGAVRATLAAVGDAVVPQITEHIGAILKPLLPDAPTVLDLFSGACAGWSVGLHRAGYRTVAICEIDPWRRAVAAHHLGQFHEEISHG